MTLETAIGSLGFPIVACAWLAMSGQKTLKELSDNTKANTAALVSLEKSVSSCPVKQGPTP